MVAARYGSGGRIWTSPDGVASALAVDTMDSVYAGSLALTPAGLVAMGGGDDMQGRAWLFRDGSEWAPLGEPVPESSSHRPFPPRKPLRHRRRQTGTLETGIDARAGVWLATTGD